MKKGDDRAPLSGYDVLLELTRGGMGRVLLARRRGVHGFERLVAIKTIRTDLSDKEDMRSMFLDEARLMARLHHPAIAQVHDFAESDGELYLVMEYVPGVSFGRLAKLRPPPEVSAEAIAEVLRGLHSAHEARDESGEPLDVVHRDISPDNLMVSFDGRVKILDFGIARMRRRQAPETQLGMVRGKPAYMSPEHLRNEPLDRRADVWGAAIVLYEMLTGEALFQGDSPFQVAHALAHREIAPPSTKAGALPDGLDAIVLRGLARDREDRYQTAEAMADALDRAVASASAPRLDAFVRRALDEEREGHDARIRAAAADLGGTAKGGASEGRPTGQATAVAAEATASDAAPTDEAGPARAIATRGPTRQRTFALVAAVAIVVAVGGISARLLRGTDSSASAATGSPEPSARAQVEVVATAASASEPQAPNPRPSVDPAPTHRVAAADARPRATASSAGGGASAAAPPVAAAATSAAAEDGFLTIGAEPYALVQLDGASIGPTPILNRKVPAGAHVVVLVSPDTGQVRLQKSVQVAAGAAAQVIAH